MQVPNKMARREFVRNVALAGAPIHIVGTRALAVPQNPPPARIVRQREPENLEYPFSTLDSFITPTDRFYVRSHFAVPEIELKTWRLRVEGAVSRPLDLTLDQLRQLPERKLPVTLECAGNGRVYLTPAARGVQWETGAVGTAEWTGVSLASVLELARVRPEAVEVILEGADSGEIREPPRPVGAIRFARSLPLQKARHPDTLLAYQMNDAELLPAHGFPLRAVVPGWYGMASIKWLSRIIVSEQPFQGYYQTIDYAIWETKEPAPDGTTDPLPRRTPITEMQVKATIARPVQKEMLPANKSYRVFGAAWAGEAEVTRVEVSADGGKTWAVANLAGKPARYCWRLWEIGWQTPEQPGRYTLVARATDSKGRVQPARRNANRENYMINHLIPVEVEVR
jgi:DMSO/TMAO reductase YedYZ molybdopterin-dependent catalytic subunit